MERPCARGKTEACTPPPEFYLVDELLLPEFVKGLAAIAPVHLWKRLYDVMIEENRLLASDTDDDSIESDSLSVASDTNA